MTNTYKVAIVDEENVEYLGDALVAESLENIANNRHSLHLANYIKKHYENHPVFSRLNDKMLREQLANFLVFIEHKAIILNETKVDENGKVKYGTMAILIIPEVIEGNLLANILSTNLDKFEEVIIERVSLSSDKILEDNPILDHDDLKIEDRIIAIAKDSVKKSGRRYC